MPCCGAEPAGAPAILTQRAARGESGRLWRRSSRACRRRLMSGKLSLPSGQVFSQQAERRGLARLAAGRDEFIAHKTPETSILEPVAAPCEKTKIQITRLVSYRIARLVSSRIGSSRLGRIVSSPRDASVRLPRERRETPDTRTKSCRPGQAARGWRQLVIAAEHRRRGLRCWLSPRRRFHVSPAQSGAETSRKCASSQLLMDLRREPSPPINPSAGPARPSGASFKRAV